MDSLRWVLLAIGALLISGIYFWDLYRSKRKPKRRSEVIFEQDISTDFHLNPNVEDGNDDALSNLNTIRASLEEETGNTNNNPAKESGTIEEPEQSKDKTSVEDDLIFLRIVATGEHEFKGLRILIATKKVEMKFGNMNIFHYYAHGDAHSEKPLFSLANMYEPGEFNLQEMDSFATKGLVVYMSLPTIMEANTSIDLLLEKSQEIAEQLEGELRDGRNQVLSKEKIQSIRDKAQRFEMQTMSG